MLNLTPMLPSALALAALLSTPLTAAEPDETVDVRTDDRRMNVAKAKARRTLPEFLAVLAVPPTGVRDLAFKYPLEGWEHIWVEQVERRGESLTGRLANNPQARGYRRGQRVTVPLSAVSDWAYRDPAGVMQAISPRAPCCRSSPPTTRARSARPSVGRARAAAPP